MIEPMVYLFTDMHITNHKLYLIGTNYKTPIKSSEIEI